MENNTIQNSNQYKPKDDRNLWQKFKGFFKNISSARQILLWYLIISLTGALLLWAPFTHTSSFNNEYGNFGVSFIDALFVSSSAFSDTGLSPLGISDTFNFFGQLVTLLLLQVGGVGWFTIKIFILTFILRKATTYNSIADGSSELGTADKNNTLGLVFCAIVISSVATLVGGLIFSLIFNFTGVDGIENYWQALWVGLYHAAASVNNSGLDIFSANDSMTTLYSATEEVLNIDDASYYLNNFAGVKVGWEILIESLTLFLFVLGGIGFGIFYDIYVWGKSKSSGEIFHFSVITKLCVVTYASVAFIGLALSFTSEGLAILGDHKGSFLSSDWYGVSKEGIINIAVHSTVDEVNSAIHSGMFGEVSLVDISTNEEIIAYTGEVFTSEIESAAVFYHTNEAFRWWTLTFNTFSTRNAGFASMDLDYLHETTKLIFSVMMFIGSGPGSTAGGLRTTTFSVLIVSLWAGARNKPQAHAYGKGVPTEVTRQAYAILSLSLAIVFINVVIISITEIALGHTTNSFIDNMFVVFSAYGTTGLAIADLGSYHWVSKVALILVMFIGQMGISNTLNQLKSKQIKHQRTYVEEHINLG